MFVCVECGTLFECPERFVETHNLDCPPYEEWDGCPRCAGAFIEAFRCHCCNEYITDSYIKTDDGKQYCTECYRERELEDELR